MNKSKDSAPTLAAMLKKDWDWLGGRVQQGETGKPVKSL